MRSLTLRLTPAAVVVRAWNGGQLLIALALALGALFLVPVQAVPVPGREGVRSLLWPLIPTLPALAAPACASVGFRELERTGARSLPGSRAVCVVLASLATGLVCLAGWRFDLMILFRNAAFLLGTAFACTAISPTAAWLPVSVIPMVMWLTGTQPGGIVEPWAILLLPRSSALAAWISWAAWGLGAGLLCSLRVGRGPVFARRRRTQPRPAPVPEPAGRPLRR